MAKLFVLMGKSSTGKDSIYRELLERKELSLKKIISYTTRPIRIGEHNGEDYFFCTQEKMQELSDSGKIIEKRAYDTVHGTWYYFTADDGQIDWGGEDNIIIGTLESLKALRKYYNNRDIIPIYIEVEDGLRLLRAVERERQEKEPKYEELCRRFLADAKDFSMDKLRELGISRSFRNESIDKTVDEIIDFIQKV